MRPYTSVLRDDDRVREAVAESTSIRGCLHFLGLRSAGGNYRALHEACARLGIEVPRCAPAEQTRGAREKGTIPLDDILVENSTYTNRGRLKERLITTGLLLAKCYGEGCSVATEWNGKPLMLQLEHCNGVWNDNRIENLALLCPNCHSQTATYCKGTASGEGLEPSLS